MDQLQHAFSAKTTRQVVSPSEPGTGSPSATPQSITWHSEQNTRSNVKQHNRSAETFAAPCFEAVAGFGFSNMAAGRGGFEEIRASLLSNVCRSGSSSSSLNEMNDVDTSEQTSSE